jgi:hypothetical protein
MPLQRQRQEDVRSEASPSKVMETQSQNKTNKRVGDVVHVVECLPTVCEVLGSIPGTIKKMIIKFRNKV